MAGMTFKLCPFNFITQLDLFGKVLNILSYGLYLISVMGYIWVMVDLVLYDVILTIITS
jgi:hypothetical protein